MFSVLNISSCKHSSGCLLLYIPSVFAVVVSKWGSPRNVDFSRPLSSTKETGVSQVFDFNWKQTKTWIWWLVKCSVLQSSPPEWTSLQGKGSQGSPSVAVQVPRQLSSRAYRLYVVASPYGTQQFPPLRKKCLFSPWLSPLSTHLSS